jgi:Tfp pilus assembly protein PilN
MILPKRTTQHRPPPDFVATVFILSLMAGGMALVDTCWSGLAGVGTAQAQEQTQQQAIENLDNLLAQYEQYEQGDLPADDPRLVAAQAKITELEAELAALREAHAALQATHAACSAGSP